MPTITLPERPFTSAQALELGLKPRALRHAVAAGKLRRLLRDAYLPVTTELTLEIWAAAVQLVVSEHAVVCDRTAAQLHGVDVRRYAELEGTPPLETYVLRGHDPTDRPQCAGGVRDLCDRDWCWMGELRITTPVRTAMDLGCKLPRREAMAAIDALMRQHGFTVAEMQALLPRYFRRRGVIQLRQLVPLADPRHESRRESWTKLAVADAHLPLPHPQYWIVIDGVPTFRLDFAYPHLRVVVEYDGEEFHSSPEQMAHDQQRREWLRRHGWIVIVLTKESFIGGAEDAWLAELRITLRERARLIGL